PQWISQDIGPDLSNHLHRIAQPRDGNRLIRPFSSRMHLEFTAQHRLPCGWNSCRNRYQVQIDASHHANWLLTRPHGVPLLFSAHWTWLQVKESEPGQQQSAPAETMRTSRTETCVLAAAQRKTRATRTLPRQRK